MNDLNGDGELDRDEVYKMQSGVFAAVKAAFAVGLREGIQELIAPKGPLTRPAFEDLMRTLLPIFDLEEVIQFATAAVFVSLIITAFTYKSLNVVLRKCKTRTRTAKYQKKSSLNGTWTTNSD